MLEVEFALVIIFIWADNSFVCTDWKVNSEQTLKQKLIPKEYSLVWPYWIKITDVSPRRWRKSKQPRAVLGCTGQRLECGTGRGSCLYPPDGSLPSDSANAQLSLGMTFSHLPQTLPWHGSTVVGLSFLPVQQCLGWPPCTPSGPKVLMTLLAQRTCTSPAHHWST